VAYHVDAYPTPAHLVQVAVVDPTNSNMNLALRLGHLQSAVIVSYWKLTALMTASLHQNEC